MNETLKRALSGVVYIVLLLTSILYSKESFFILFGFFLMITVHEYCNLVGFKKIVPTLFAVLFFIILIAFNHYSEEVISILEKNFQQKMDINIDFQKLYIILLAITLVVSFKCILFLFYDSVQTISTSSKYLYLLGYVILPFVFITEISFGIFGYNPKIIIGLFVLIWTNDTFAYLVGKSLGKHKLLERVSPKKTIEGFVGGLVFAVFTGFLLSEYYIRPKPEFSQKSIFIWMSIAVIVGFMGTIGDLIESKFKRVAGVKDSGKIMPGHGGLLDRLDSVIFVAPFIYLFYQILYYVS